MKDAVVTVERLEKVYEPTTVQALKDCLFPCLFHGLSVIPDPKRLVRYLGFLAHPTRQISPTSYSSLRVLLELANILSKWLLRPTEATLVGILSSISSPDQPFFYAGVSTPRHFWAV
jgi:hypothetical protein